MIWETDVINANITEARENMFIPKISIFLRIPSVAAETVKATVPIISVIKINESVIKITFM